MRPAEIENLIRASIGEAEVSVRSEDNIHFEALVIAPVFTGMKKIQRHQLVHASLGELLGSEIHALSITTLSPDEWRQAASANKD